MKCSNFAFTFALLIGCACDAPDALAQEPRFAVHIPTAYDIGNSFAAEVHRVYVAEDDGGWIEVPSVRKLDPPITKFRTGYQRDADIAVDDHYLYVAEDNGGRVEVHDLKQGGSLVDAFTTTFNRGDALAASMSLVFVEEDDGTAGWSRFAVARRLGGRLCQDRAFPDYGDRTSLCYGQ